ncbi:MAG: hypothetical protein KR126chlam1_00520 [Chlamydiae bacterium]|nr:hypothetical protein [Chlamydiota bacterium]
MQNLNPSLVGAAYKTVGPLTVVYDDDTCLEACAIYTTGVLAFSVLALAGIVETVVRNVLALAAKGVEFFLSGEKKEDFNLEILTPSIYNARKTVEYTGRAAAAIVTQFLSRETRSQVASSIHRNVRSLYGQPVRRSRSNSNTSNASRSSDQSRSRSSSNASNRGGADEQTNGVGGPWEVLGSAVVAEAKQNG